MTKRQARRCGSCHIFNTVKDSDPTPVRVVYNAKARYQGHLLNDYLSKGENLNSDLCNVALRFREYEVGIIADTQQPSVWSQQRREISH